MAKLAFAYVMAEARRLATRSDPVDPEAVYFHETEIMAAIAAAKKAANDTGLIHFVASSRKRSPGRRYRVRSQNAPVRQSETDIAGFQPTA